MTHAASFSRLFALLTAVLCLCLGVASCAGGGGGTATGGGGGTTTGSGGGTTTGSGGGTTTGSGGGTTTGSGGGTTTGSGGGTTTGSGGGTTTGSGGGTTTGSGGGTTTGSGGGTTTGVQDIELVITEVRLDRPVKGLSTCNLLVSVRNTGIGDATSIDIDATVKQFDQGNTVNTFDTSDFGGAFDVSAGADVTVTGRSVLIGPGVAATYNVELRLGDQILATKKSSPGAASCAT